MSDALKNAAKLPPEQQAIRDKCFHPSGTFVEFPIEAIEQSIPQLFEKIVERYPDRLAVKMSDRAFTYDELNKASNRIARAILDGREPYREPVIVLFDQGIDAIAAILAVLKAGKFYVPVDPSFPSDRITAIFEDSGAALVLTGKGNLAAARGAGQTVLNIDEISKQISDENLNLPLSPDDLAYIIYTSGSTGKPKGVFQKQRNVLQWTLLHSNTLHICNEDRLSLMHSHSTGGGMLNMYGALINGAALFPFDFRSDGVQLARWLMAERITIYHSGPLVFRQWVDGLIGTEMFPDLRLIRLSGMPMSAEDVVRYQRHFSPDCLLVHVLGTSEAGTIPHYFIDKRSKVPESPVPVGYSVGDSKVFVVDESGRRTEPEVVGEIAILSRFLVCGYWRNPKLSNERFLPDPDGGEERIYFSGDLGRMSADGCLCHLGRKDFKVKIRGYSVEIGEIEGALSENPAIKDVVIISGADAREEPRLIAYIVPVTSAQLTASALRNYLLDKLPEYMIPSVFVTLQAMPLMSNGKIDRKALPPPPDTRPGLEVPYVAPRTPLEQALRQIWSEVVHLEDIGVYDNFFDLGGHSLRAAQVIARIRKSFQVEVRLQDFFATPTLVALADYIENAPQNSDRREIFPLERVSPSSPLPLSFAQQRLWFLDQLEPDSARYNVALALLVTGSLDVGILKQCLNEIVKRHESLRTVIGVVDGRPYQNVIPSIKLDLPVVDLRQSICEAARDSAIRQYIGTEAQRRFDLSSGPLIRSHLLTLDSQRNVLLLILHHVAFDGWSGAVFRQEIASLYADLLRREPISLTDLPIQYSDYAAWQKRSLQGAILENLLTFWKRQLENLPRLELPTDRPRLSLPSWRGARKYFSLSTTTNDSLNALGRRADATLFMVLLAAFQTLLYRYTGQSDVVTGTPVAGRSCPEIENLIGFFLNMLVLRVDLSGNPTFRQLLARTRQSCLDAYAHEDLPFEILVEELKPERSINQNPLFQVSFVLQNFPKAPFESAGIKAVEMDIDPGIARFDLHVFMTEEENSLKGYFEYSTDLFDERTIARMVDHFINLLERIAADPEQRISELPLLSESERQLILVEWNDTKCESPRDQCLYDLFETQAEKTPDAVAVIFEGLGLTYQELNHRANQLARYLRKVGIGPEILVGVCMERSPEMIVGLLGVLKAGGAYLPLDVNQPRERAEFMLRDSGAVLLLTRASVRDRFDGFSGRQVCLDRDWPEFEHESKTNLGSVAAAENLAYVIYTSGSTGQPKGVAIEHRNAVAFLAWARSAFTAEELSGVLFSTSICFDLSVFEIFAPLTCGGTIILAENALALTAISEASKVTLLNTVPSTLHELLILDAIPPSVRVINLAGEPLRADMVRRIYASTSASKVHDLYGPTECTTYSTWIRRSAEEPECIGRPIANTQVYILDSSRNPVPIGVVGEIYIGGAGVARGYLNRSELTAERFIEHSFDGELMRRLYRTGDLARFLADGNIEFLGRKDDQVKLRGYRIELGEIETVLRQHPAVRESAVMVREDHPGDQRLVANVVVQSESFDVLEVRKFLKQKLPEYMIPAAIMPLQRLPLTPNGKLDRKALPAPNGVQLNREQVFVGPRTPVEAEIANIWAEVLKIDKVGAHDNFFALGGHSLLATQVISRIRRSFHNDLPLRAIFDSPTVAEMAAIIVKDYSKQPDGVELSEMVRDLEAMSDAEAEKRLAKDGVRS